MSRVKVVFYGALVRVTGEREVEVEAPTLKEALGRLTSKYGDGFEEDGGVETALTSNSHQKRRYGLIIRKLNYYYPIVLPIYYIGE